MLNTKDKQPILLIIFGQKMKEYDDLIRSTVERLSKRDRPVSILISKELNHVIHHYDAQFENLETLVGYINTHEDSLIYPLCLDKNHELFQEFLAWQSHYSRQYISDNLSEKSVQAIDNNQDFVQVDCLVMRDSLNNCLYVSDLEYIESNKTTGKSLAIVPSQTLSDAARQTIRDVAFDVCRKANIIGVCYFSLLIDLNSLDYHIISLSSGLSHQSILFETITTYPVLEIATKLTVGYTFSQLKHSYYPNTSAFLEPQLDYVATVSFSFEKVDYIFFARNIEQLFLNLLEASSHDHFPFLSDISEEDLMFALIQKKENRLAYLLEAFRRGFDLYDLSSVTKINPFYLDKCLHIVELYENLNKSQYNVDIYKEAKRYGFSDDYIASSWQISLIDMLEYRKKHSVAPVLKQVEQSSGVLTGHQIQYFRSYDWHSDYISSGCQKALIMVDKGYSLVKLNELIKQIKQTHLELLIVTNQPLLIEQLNDTSIIFDTIGIETILTIMGIEEVEEVYLLGESQADMFSKMKNFSISCQSI
ncbi:TPA: carbamoyl phosphate synthase large subunit [Streptococcus agalactiae]